MDTALSYNIPSEDSPQLLPSPAEVRQGLEAYLREHLEGPVTRPAQLLPIRQIDLDIIQNPVNYAIGRVLSATKLALEQLRDGVYVPVSEIGNVNVVTGHWWRLAEKRRREATRAELLPLLQYSVNPKRYDLQGHYVIEFTVPELLMDEVTLVLVQNGYEPRIVTRNFFYLRIL